MSSTMQANEILAPIEQLRDYNRAQNIERGGRNSQTSYSGMTEM